MSEGWFKSTFSRLTAHRPLCLLLGVPGVEGARDGSRDAADGDARAESVSGDITIETDSESVEAGAVSGDVKVKANGAKEVEVEAVSGDVTIEGVSGSTSDPCARVTARSRGSSSSVSHAGASAYWATIMGWQVSSWLGPT